MYSYTIAQWLLFFYIYCFFGWCIESTWVSVHQKRFVNRGFLRGTWIPIYGFGAMAMLLAAVPAGGNWFWMFISGMFFASVLEYITGACMEKIFKVRYWDYSDKKFNLNGHICLGTSIAWGLLTIALTQFIHQPMERLVTEVPQFWSNLVAAVLSILFAADVAVSTKAALDFRRVLVALSTAREKAQELAAEVRDNMGGRLEGLKESAGDRLDELKGGAEGLRESVEDKFEDLRELLGSRLDDLKENLGDRVEELRGPLKGHRLDYFQRSLLRSNPGAKSSEYAEALRLLQKRMEERRQEKRARRRKKKRK